MKGLIFTFALTYGGAVLSLFRPFYGLLIYVAFSILRPESLWHWSVPQGGNYSRIVAIALLIGWALNGFGNWNLSRGRTMLLCFAGFWGWALLSTLFAALFPDRGFAFVEAMAKILLPFLVGITVINSIDQIKQLAWTIGLSVSYVALEMNLAYYDGFNFLHQNGFGGMDNNCMAIQFVSAVGFMFFLGFAAQAWWQRIIAIAGVLIMINAIMFSFSRGGLLSLIITAGVAFLLIPKRPVHYLAFAAAVAAGIRLAGPATLQRFASTFADKEVRDESAQSRLDLWADCWQLMQDNPLFGVGPDHFTHYAKYELGWGSFKEAHSLWFQTGAELGFIGVGFLIAFYLTCIGYLWPLTRDAYPTAEPRLRDLARMVIASLAGFMISSQFVTLEGLEMPYYVVLIGACTLKIAPQYDLAHAPYAFNQLPLPLGEGQGEGAAPWDLALAPSPLGRGSG
jgi:probable O-glycosylation ligase (exosortase A-associated)